MSVDTEKARSIFLAAVEDHAPDEWENYLDEACRDDAALRKRVALLLRAHRGEDSLLDRGNTDDLHDDTGRSVAEGVGTVIGPYKLVEQIGEGGFGIVFLAEQSTPVRRKVALKIVKPGM